MDASITRLEDAVRDLRNPARMPMPTDAAERTFLLDEIADARRRLRELLT